MAVTRKFAIAASISTLIYLGLAVFGIGGFAAFFSHPQLTVVAVATLALAVVALFTEGNLSAGERENRDNRWVLAAFAVTGFLLAYLPALTDRLDVWTFGGDTVRWSGVVLYVAGGVLRLWPVFVLGKRFSGLVAIQPGHTLVTDGIYRRIRNPSYLGLLVNAAGWALAFRSGVGLLLVASMMIPLVARIRSEEALLRARFGAEYDTYCAHSWRLIPGVY
ncbi:isoprenylcysteine carboxyl methyltransferase [Burkholderia territorii]|uniref:Isoprenylcysteine carboxyl methyltransferase n=1 Tax=Burkholderia territorii TaxID=1503055 RepID=A0A125A8W3_9BURK|nr:isoprenylcysteine carboxylmethyltransferase family protein [Burkholderia territorii]KVV39502.1 isoprenylcysteine carboxyl methyltransferase [Burkholderia territorii]KVX27179.1 isoprenylcysteine carboxyl methyltransferase [Burkholderia territorii]